MKRLTPSEFKYLEDHSAIVKQVRIAKDQKACISTTIDSFMGRSDLLYLALLHAADEKVPIKFEA